MAERTRFTTSKFNMNSVVKNTAFSLKFPPGKWHVLTDKVYVLELYMNGKTLVPDESADNNHSV